MPAPKSNSQNRPSTELVTTGGPAPALVQSELSTNRQVGAFFRALLSGTKASPAAKALVPWFCDKLKSPRSRKDYATDQAIFVSHLRELGIDPLDVTGDDIRLYKEAMAQSGLEDTTISRKLPVIRGTYQQFAIKGLVPWDTAQDIQAVASPAINKNTTPSLTEKEARELLHAPDTETLAGIRDHALLYVYFITICRRSAIANARVGHVIKKDHEYYLRVTEKGKKLTEKALLKAAPPLIRYMEAAEIEDDKRGPLFRPLTKNLQGLERRHLSGRQILNVVKKYARHVGLDVDPVDGRGICTHSIRKTSINNALDHGAPVQQVKALANHADIRTTQDYIDEKATDSEDAARHIQIR